MEKWSVSRVPMRPDFLRMTGNETLILEVAAYVRIQKINAIIAADNGMDAVLVMRTPQARIHSRDRGSRWKIGVNNGERW